MDQGIIVDCMIMVKHNKAELLKKQFCAECRFGIIVPLDYSLITKKFTEPLTLSSLSDSSSHNETPLFFEALLHLISDSWRTV